MPIIEIESAEDPRLAPFSDMTDAELRDPKQLAGLARAVDPHGDPRRFDGGLFVAESRNVVDRAIAAGCVPFSVIAERRWKRDALAIAAKASEIGADVSVFVSDHDTIERITGYRNVRGPIAAFLRPAEPTMREVVRDATRIAVLEDVTNYTNVGAIFRSAAALGIDAVLLTQRCHDPFYRRASRVSMGAVFQVPWARIEGSWPDDGVRALHDEGFVVAAFALGDDSVPLKEFGASGAEKLAIVLGTEGDGLAPDTIAACDVAVRIPMAHGVDSLNVAAACAVAFWELCC